ncbi:uncharacterized protein LOC119482734 [Sebastes umbrosus]|uniref:uncharacterized protein LOC119482734 n=1 Tax=Sebastes umbrosus TaxID=72105 RepID=UPI00189CE988|nr:uncharacterized protein LOC119482734 [Sebastes umbrosus]
MGSSDSHNKPDNSQHNSHNNSHNVIGSGNNNTIYLRSQGFTRMACPPTKATKGNARSFWFKHGTGIAPITRIQLTFNDEMSVGLIKAGYKKLPTPFIPEPGADPIYIWFFQGSGEYDTPIVDLEVTTTAEEEALKFQEGWEKLACDLNRGAGGSWLYIWVKREKPTFICDVAVTDSFKSGERYFQDGWIRVDVDAHKGAGGEHIFIWYRQTTDPKRALSDLKVSTTKCEFQALQQQEYQPVNLNFNELCGSPPLYLWYKREESGKPIKALTLVLDTAAVPVYKKAGIPVIEKDLNPGTKDHIEYLCFNQ